MKSPVLVALVGCAGAAPITTRYRIALCKDEDAANDNRRLAPD